VRSLLGWGRQRSAHCCQLIVARCSCCATWCCADWDAVIRSDLPLKVVASSLTSLRSEVLDNFTDRGDLVECLKASANVPEIVGGPRSHRGHQLVDAAVFEPLPIKAALRCAGFCALPPPRTHTMFVLYCGVYEA
jgi:predicted acylesterase/phospholipase RssA